MATLGLITGSNEATVLRMTQALYGVAPGYTYYNYFKSYAEANGQSTFAAALGNGFATTTDAALATTVLTNLGLSAFTDLQSALETAFAAYGTAARGQIILNLTNILAGLESDSTYGVAATAFNNQINNGYSYSVVAANTAPQAASSSAAAQNFVLTSGVDTGASFTGGSGNDTFVADNTAAPSQFTAADSLNGGAGTDTLTIYGTNTVTVANMTSIENVIVDSMAAGAAWNFAAITGIQNLTNSRAVGASGVTVADGVAVTLSHNAASAAAQTVTFGATDTSVNLTLDKIVITGANDLAVNGAAATTLNITTTGSASSVAQKIDGDALMTKLVVKGDQNLTIGTTGTAGLEAAIKTVDATSFTGKLSVVTGNTGAGTNLTTDAGLSVTGGSGDDTIDVSASDAADNVVVVTGEGANTVRTLNANLTATEKYTAGSGTNDTLQVDFANTTATQAVDMSALITGFENLEVLSNATGAQTETLAMATNKIAVSNIIWSGDAGDTLAITGLGAAKTVTVKTNAVAVSAAIGTDTTADTVSVALDGTTIGTLTATNYETVNISSAKDSSSNTNALTTGTLASATTVNLSGAGDLVGGTITMAAAATFNAVDYSGDLTATTFGDSVKSYVGGSGKDQITLVAGDLKQGNTFGGGAGTADTLTVAATANQDMGIIGLTGFETVSLTSHDDVAVNLTKADLRNVTDLTTLTIASGNGGDDQFTLNRLSADTTLKFGSDTGAVVTTLNSGTTQKIAFGGNFTAASVTLDSGTTTLTVTSSNGDTTADEAGGVFSALSGTSLATIILDGLDRTDLGTVGATVTSIDASSSKGGLTVTASATATTVVGSQAADTITGGGAADTITGGEGGDTLSGAGGADSYVFASTAALNGSDTVTMVVADDILNFKNFLSGGSVDQNGGAGTAIVAYAAANNSDVNITNKVAVFDTNGAALNAAGLVAEIQAAGNAFAITSGGKAIVISGDASAPGNAANIFFVDDTLDGVNGTISATDCVIVGVTSANFDVDTLISTNFAFA